MTRNPFDWTSGPFLAFYLTAAVVVFAWAFSLRAAIGPAAQTSRRLNVLELAYLAGGARRLGDAVLLRLTSGKGATIAAQDHKINVTDQSPLAALMGRPAHLSIPPNVTRQQFQTAI